MALINDNVTADQKMYLERVATIPPYAEFSDTFQELAHTGRIRVIDNISLALVITLLTVSVITIVSYFMTQQPFFIFVIPMFIIMGYGIGIRYIDVDLGRGMVYFVSAQFLFLFERIAVPISSIESPLVDRQAGLVILLRNVSGLPIDSSPSVSLSDQVSALAYDSGSNKHWKRHLCCILEVLVSLIEYDARAMQALGGYRSSYLVDASPRQQLGSERSSDASEIVSDVDLDTMIAGSTCPNFCKLETEPFPQPISSHDSLSEIHTYSGRIDSRSSSARASSRSSRRGIPSSDVTMTELAGILNMIDREQQSVILQT